MRLLLDTHIFLWYIMGDPSLPQKGVDAIRDPSNEVFLSAVSLWEVIVKYQTGKLPLPAPPQIFVPMQRQRHQIATLPLDEPSVMHLSRLPLYHRDPFDRMLICQALASNLTLLTVDAAIKAYPVPILAL